MKTIPALLALSLVLPAAAHAQAVSAPEKPKMECCCKDKDRKMACCDERGKAGKDEHEGHEGHGTAKPQS